MQSSLQVLLIPRLCVYMPSTFTAITALRSLRTLEICPRIGRWIRSTLTLPVVDAPAHRSVRPDPIGRGHSSASDCQELSAASTFDYRCRTLHLHFGDCVWPVHIAAIPAPAVAHTAQAEHVWPVDNRDRSETIRAVVQVAHALLALFKPHQSVSPVAPQGACAAITPHRT